MTSNVYERIATAITRRRGARLVALVVPEGTPVYLSIEMVVPQLEGRGVRLRHVRFDPDAQLAELVELEGSARSDDADDTETLLIHGFESVPLARTQAFFRRSNFTRARLAKLSIAVLLTVGSETWSWLVMELPDLVRWTDGPFLLPAIETPPHPLVGLPWPRAHLGVPIPEELDRPLDRERGVDVFGPALDALEHERLIVLGGPPGVGVSHLAVRLEAEMRSKGRTTAWPPNVHDVDGQPMVGDRSMVPSADVPFPKTLSWQPFERWLDAQSADVIIVPRAFADQGRARLTKLRRCGIVLSSTTSALGSEAGFALPIYVPPVRVETGSEPEPVPYELGVTLLQDALETRARLLGHCITRALTPPALRFLVLASGGVPSLLWRLACETSRRAALEAQLPAPDSIARVVALDMGTKWLQLFRSQAGRVSHPSMRRRSLRRREEDEGLRQVLFIDHRTVRHHHPLVRLAAGGARETR